MATAPPPPETCLKCGGDIFYKVDQIWVESMKAAEKIYGPIYGPTEYVLNEEDHVCQNPPDEEAIRMAFLLRRGINYDNLIK